MSSNLIEEITALGGRTQRVQAIADDLNSGARKYAAISPWDLAEKALEICLEDGSEKWISVSVAPQVSLDQYEFESTPVADHIELIFDHVDSDKALKWQQHLEEIISGKREDDIKINDEERDLLEKAMTLSGISDGPGWIVRMLKLEGCGGAAIEFQVCIGDAGDPFDLLGPYQLADGESSFSDDLVVGDSY